MLTYFNFQSSSSLIQKKSLLEFSTTKLSGTLFILLALLTWKDHVQFKKIGLVGSNFFSEQTLNVGVSPSHPTQLQEWMHLLVRDARNAKINDTFVHSKCPILVTFKTDCGVIFIFYSRIYMDVVGRNIHYIRILFLLILNFNPHLI